MKERKGQAHLKEMQSEREEKETNHDKINFAVRIHSFFSLNFW